MMIDEKKIDERLRETWIWLIGACFAAAFVIAIAVALAGDPPEWGNALRWIFAGYSFAGVVSALSSFRAAVRAKNHLAGANAEMDTIAQQFVDHIVAKLAEAGIEAEGEIIAGNILHFHPKAKGPLH